MKRFMVLCFVSSLAFLSCSSQISGIIHENGSADISVLSFLEPKTAVLLQSFSQNENGSVIDSAAINVSVSAAPGVSSAQFENIDLTTIAGTINISQIDDFLLAEGSSLDAYRFVRYEQNDSEGSLSINLDLSKGPEIISFFSADVSDYFSAIMAPLATGEVLSVSEYLDLVVSVYGNTISNEIEHAFVNIDISVPGLVKDVKGGTFSGSKAHFSVPLTDLLVLENPVSYEITWNNQ